MAKYGFHLHKKPQQLFTPEPMCYINLPTPPADLISNLPMDANSYDESYIVANGGRFQRSKAHIQQLNQWCKSHISSGMEWDVQVIREDLRIHLDTGTQLKLIMILHAGGDAVETRFFKPNHGIEKLDPNLLADYDDRTIHPMYQSCEHITHSFVIRPRQWHILKVNLPHNVVNLDKDKCRISLVANLC